MKWPENKVSPPAGRTPKSLFRLCAEKISDTLAVKTLPVIELFFMEEEFSPTQHFPDKGKVLEHLCALRNWYWKDGCRWFGHSDSEIRYEISRHMNDVLDFHSAVLGGPRDQQLFSVFVFQLMFQFEAGKLLTNQRYGADHLSKNLDVFLKSMGTLNITAFYNCNLLFFDSSPLRLILQHAPYLQRIQIDLCFDAQVLNIIRLHCCSLKEIILDCNSFNPIDDLVDHLVDHLCKAFFSDLTLDELLQKMKDGDAVTLSFPKLQLAWFHGKNNWDGGVPNQFIFLLQHFYKDLRTKWVCNFEDDDALAITFDPGVFCPPFVKENDRFYWDDLVFHSLSSDEDVPESSDLSFKLVSLNANHAYLFYHDLSMVSRYPNFLRTLRRRFNCNSIALQYCMTVSEHLGTIFSSAGETLRELKLMGSLHRIADVEQLYVVLNTCVNLTCLALELKMYVKPMKSLINPLLKLETLSIKCKHESGCENISGDFAAEQNGVGDGNQHNVQPAFQSFSNTNFLLGDKEFQRDIEDYYGKMYNQLLSSAQNIAQASEIVYGCNSDINDDGFGHYSINDYSCSSGGKSEVRERVNQLSDPRYKSGEILNDTPDCDEIYWFNILGSARGSEYTAGYNSDHRHHRNVHNPSGSVRNKLSRTTSSILDIGNRPDLSESRLENMEWENGGSDPRYESAESITNPPNSHENNRFNDLRINQETKVTLHSISDQQQQDREVFGPTRNLGNQFSGILKQEIAAPSPSSILEVGLDGASVHGQGLPEYQTFINNHYKMAVFTGYGKPAFAFYGHSNYGYKISDQNLSNPMVIPDVISSSVPVRHSPYLDSRINDGLPERIEYHANHHNNLSQYIRNILVQNRSAEERENPQIPLHSRFDSDAQLPLLYSIVSASPNLKVLELQDLRIPNISAVFQNSEVSKNLAQVHTLYLSSKFSVNVIKTITTLPSLKTVRLNPQFGIDHYLKFKSALKRTNLVVEMDDDSVLRVDQDL